MRLQIFLSTVPGLEPLLGREVEPIAGSAKVVPGGVETTGDATTLARLLVEVGLASHVLLRVATFSVWELAELESHVGRLPWSGWLRRGEARRVKATAQRSRLYHTGAIEERVVRGIQKRLKDELPPAVALAPGDKTDDADLPVTIHVRMVDDRCTISIDAAGAPLHRRGYRLNPYKAPIREDLARALVMASGWDPSRPFVDPLCGSGTLVIEAALLSTQRAPGLLRSFAMERTALDDGVTLARVRSEARAKIRPAPAPLFGGDRDPRAIQAAIENASRAFEGGEVPIRFAAQPLSSTRQALLDAGMTPEARPAIVTNPPWGERLGETGSLKPLYQAIGSLTRSLPGSTLTLAAHDRRLAYGTGVPLTSAFLTELGGMKVAAMIQGSSATNAAST